MPHYATPCHTVGKGGLRRVGVSSSIAGSYRCGMFLVLVLLVVYISTASTQCIVCSCPQKNLVRILLRLALSVGALPTLVFSLVLMLLPLSLTVLCAYAGRRKESRRSEHSDVGGHVNPKGEKPEGNIFARDSVKSVFIDNGARPFVERHNALGMPLTLS